MKVSVHHWRHEDGTLDRAFGHPGINPPVGWYCWAYTDDDRAFESWMAENCPTADVTHRFNSGNPMHTVYITKEQEASVFALRWVNRD
jgi:hypothetical protein